MTLRIGYLLPTREHAMAGVHETRSLLKLAERAEALGLDSIWVGDSLLARPRQEPLALLAAVAARTERLELGTAVLLPALRNPVLLAHQTATLDRIAEGRLILGVGIARDVPAIRAEFLAADVPFDKRVGRMLEGLRLCRALWRGEKVDWDGRWQVRGGILAPTPHRPGGPPLWLAGALPASIARTGKHFDGWMPNGSDPSVWARQWAEIKSVARAAGRNDKAMVGAIYLTATIDDDAARAQARMDAYLEAYYTVPAEITRGRQSTYAGPATGLEEWLREYVDAGVSHIILRCAGDQEKHLEALAAIRARFVG